MFVNQPSLFNATVFASLIKTKHKAVLVKLDLGDGVNSHSAHRVARRKVKVYDLKPHNIDALRAAIVAKDWNEMRVCTDVETVYNMFRTGIIELMNNCIPARNVRLGRRDPEFMTPVIKGLLADRAKLRKQGKTDEADRIADKINKMIKISLSKRLAGLEAATPKQLWRSVNTSQSGKTYRPNFVDTVDADKLNSYFASVSFDSAYDVNDTLKFRVPLETRDVVVYVHDYEVEPLLRKVQSTSPGADPFPAWLFQLCSVELADLVAHVFNCTFTFGSVPSSWRQSLVTPIPKIQNPTSFADLRPISVTPILSRIAEKFIVRRWLRPAVPSNVLDDQFGFKLTGSTTCAMTYFYHHIAKLLENNDYVRCLLIDFSKAFDTVNHTVLFSKLSKFDLPPFVVNWLISFLSNRTQACKINGSLTSYLATNLSIVQGSGIGPYLYITLESDLKTLSVINLFMKYADDTNLLVPQNTDVTLEDEFENVRQWSADNKMTINVSKTKEIVFRRPNVRREIIYPAPLPNIQRVTVAKLLGIVITENIKFSNHVDNILRQCNQRMYLLKLLRDQGLPINQLKAVCFALIVNRVTYALSAWGGFCSAHDRSRIDAFLKRVRRYGFMVNTVSFDSLLSQADSKLFNNMCRPSHCLNQLLPPIKPVVCRRLRKRNHNFVLPQWHYELYKNSFIMRCLYNSS